MTRVTLRGMKRANEHTSSDPDLATRLARALGPGFAVLRELGRGGMGVVYLARDLQLDRPVAVKVLPPALADSADLRDRFLREARTAANLSHPNIVPIYRADESDGLAFFVMAYVDGETLGEHVAVRGALPPVEAVRYLREAAWALAYAHARGVVHRDVKPDNLMVEHGSGRVLVTDFGIARRQQDARLTADGHVLGSVHFMSPEQVAGGPLDGRSDLYALGAVGFLLLSGRLPFEGDAPGAVLVAHASRPAPPLRSVAPMVPPALAAVIDRCLAKEPEQRYSSGELLAEALTQALAATEVEGGESGAHPARLSEAQAAAVWKRAAQLQLEAARRLEERSEASARAAGSAEAGAAAPTSSYRLRDVEEAAVEAGISQQYVALALAELATPAGAVAAPVTIAPWQELFALRLLGDPRRSVSVSRTIPADPRRVLAAVGQVLQAPPFSLVLRDSVGGHPLAGGILVFDLPAYTTGWLDGYAWMYVRYNCYAEQVRVTLRPVPGGEPAVELTLTVDAQAGWRKNLRDAGWLSALFGGTGAVVGAAIGIGALALGPLAVAPAVAGLTVGAGATLTGIGPLYRWGLKKVRAELDRAAGAVEASVRSVDVFGAQLPGSL
jgi:eukaryotic-like serine/threonine-protein kinase